jgi:Carboxypeptidase regulatory-like domain
MKIRAVAIMLAVVVSPMAGIRALGQCTPTSTEKTRWGGNTNVVIEEPEPVRSIRGIVRDPTDKPLTGVLVEVYDHPEIVLQNSSPERAGQKRIAACVTSEGGSFSFNVPPGHYELRFSKSSEWNVTSVPVKITKLAAASKTSMTVRLYPGR